MRACLLLALVSLAGCSERATTPGPTRDAGAVLDAAGTLDSGADLDGGGELDADLAIDAGPRDAFVPVDAFAGDAAVGCDGTMVALPYPSETPGSDRTDPPSCAGCPAFSGVSASPIGTTVSVSGTATGIPTECRWYLESTSCGGASGAFLPSEFTTFSLTLPLFCGTNTLQLVCENASGRAVSTRTLAGPACASRDLQVTLSWGATAYDMELHLVREGAVINDPTGDCTWFTCIAASPDWGVVGDTTDDPRKDVDNTGTYGPENIYLTRAGDGRYDVMVEYWGSGTMDTSEVTITLGGTTVWRGARAMSLYDVWHVGTLEFPAATFTEVGTLTPCASAWRTGGSRGCALPIP
jgi:hypothetical protein